MNIFYLHSCPVKAATLQYNKHVVKMILETAQLLCTAHHELGNHDVPYKPTHRNHPSAVWARQDAANYAWLYKHMIGLGDEYTKRYGKTHLTIEKCKDVLKQPPANLQWNEFNEPPQCMPDEYKVENNAIHGYWRYYIGGKRDIAAQTETIYTDVPSWAK